MKQNVFHHEAKLAILSQCGVVVSLFPFIGILIHFQGAFSFLLGGIIAILPNFYLLVKFFSESWGCPKRTLGAFFRGQAVKWILVATGFIMAVQFTWILPLWLFFGFIFAQIGFGILPFRLAMKKRQLIKAYSQR